MNLFVSTTVALISFATFAAAEEKAAPPKITKANLIEMEELVKQGADPNSTPHRFYGPSLHAATHRGNLPLVELLLAQPGIDVNLRDLDGRTALMPAAKAGHVKIVEALLAAGADPKIKNRRGQTAVDESQVEIDKRRNVISLLQDQESSRSDH